MKKLSSLLIAIALVVVPMQALAADQNSIVVSGQAMVTEKPDKAILAISFDTKSKTLRETNQKSRQFQDEIVKAFAKYGVTAADVSTTYWNWYPELAYDEAGKSSIANYNSNRSINVNFTSNIDKIDSAIDSIPSVSGVSVTSSSVSYMLTSSSTAFQKGRTLAIADAKAKAIALAKDLGVNLGSVTRVEDANNFYEVYASTPNEAVVNYYISLTYSFN
jgi:uncharacterized protein YggE